MADSDRASYRPIGTAGRRHALERATASLPVAFQVDIARLKEVGGGASRRGRGLRQ